MNVLNFISDSPRINIFQKNSNKTNLGGILTFIYLFFLLFIIVAYLFYYFNYEKYEFSYFYKYLLNETQREELKKIKNIILSSISVFRYKIKMEKYYKEILLYQYGIGKEIKERK